MSVNKIDKIPIDQFVKKTFDTAAVQNLIGTWHIPPEQLQDATVQHFSDMGVFSVAPLSFRKLITEEVFTFLKKSPEIERMRRDAKKKYESQQLQRRFRSVV